MDCLVYYVLGCWVNYGKNPYIVDNFQCNARSTASDCTFIWQNGCVYIYLKELYISTDTALGVMRIGRSK